MKKGFVLFFLLLITLSSFAQFDNEFWFAPPYANPVHDPNNQYRFVFSTSDLPSTVTISQPANSSFTPITFSISANSNYIATIPAVYANASQPNMNSNRGFKIVATEKVFCYYEIYTQPGQTYEIYNTEIFSLKGKNALGTNFFIPMQNYLANHTYTQQCYNYFSIIARENNTTVTITPTQAIDGHAANVPFTITLNMGEFYTAKAVGFSAIAHPTGSIVVSDKKVAITYYDDSMSGTPFGGCADTGGDQIIPTNLLGTWYIAVQGFAYHNSNSTGATGPYDPVFILATQNNTQVTINGTVMTTLNAGQTYQYQFTANPLSNSANSAAFIQTTNPVYVSQVSGFACELGYSILPPVKCRGSRSVSVTRSQGDNYYITLVTSENYISNFTLNGASGIINASDFQSVPGTYGLYRFARKLLSTTQFPVGTTIRIENTAGNFSMGVINGGPGNTCKFGYFSDFAQYPVLCENTTSDSICEGDTINLFISNPNSAGLYTWSFLDANNDTIQGPSVLTSLIIPNVTTANSGTYLIQGSYGSCIMDADTITIQIFEKPVVDFLSTLNCIDNPSSYENLSNGAVSYQWDFGDGESSTQSDPTHTYITPGAFNVTLIGSSDFGCTDTAQYAIEISPGIEVYDTVHVCPGLNYDFYGNELTLTGDYEHFIDSEGCDSTIYLHLEKIEASVAIHQEPQDFCEFQTAILMAESEFPNFIWSTGETTPQIVVTAPGTYMVTATQDDCEVSASFKISPCEMFVYLPNTITPGEEDGLNDYFCLQPNIIDQIVEFEVSIFDRWGNMVFYSKDPSFKWKGSIIGTDSYNTIYTYKMIVRFDKIKAKLIVGSITVL